MLVLSQVIIRAGQEMSRKTVIELWCRSKSGHSVLLLVNGLNPYIEISDPMTNTNSKSPNLIFRMKLSDDWRVVGEPLSLGNKLYEWTRKTSLENQCQSRILCLVSNTLKENYLQSDGMSQVPIFFLVHRLLMDCDLGPHISFRGEILWAGKRAPDSIPKVYDSNLAAEKIKQLGGAGRCKYRLYS